MLKAIAAMVAFVVLVALLGVFFHDNNLLGVAVFSFWLVAFFGLMVVGFKLLRKFFAWLR